MKFLSGDEKYDALQKQLALLTSASPRDAAAIAGVERQLAAIRDERLAKAQQQLQQSIFRALMR